MQANYVLISWNETAQVGGYYVTDLSIGIVVAVTRDFNTGPAYLLDALKAVPWLGQAISKLGMSSGNSWRSWKLLVQKRPEPYNQWVAESVSQIIRVGSTISEEALPPLPDTATVKATIKAQGSFQQALGNFTTQLLDKGYSVSFPADPYDIDVCYEKGNVFVTHSGAPPSGYDTWNYEYKVHVRFWWEFTTTPEIATQPTAGIRGLFVFTASIIAAIILSVGAVIWGSIVAYNLTTTRTEYQKWGWRQNPVTGEWEWVITDSGSTQGPPEWWSFVVPLIALIGVGGAVYFLLPLRPKGKR